MFKNSFFQSISFGPSMTLGVKVLLWINVFIYGSIALGGFGEFTSTVTYQQLFITLFGLHPSSFFQAHTYWQLVTYLFTHQSFLHLVFNMLGLWWFGSEVEKIMGTRRFFQYYFFTGIGAGLASLAMGTSTIGASGAIYGLLLAYGVMFPERVLLLYFIIPIKAKYCVFIFGLIELLATYRSHSNINHAAHLAGIVFGLLWFYVLIRKQTWFARWQEYQKIQKRKKFRVITNVDLQPSVTNSLVDETEGKTIH